MTDQKRQPLPKPAPPPADLWRTLAGRRSRRDYTAKPLSLQELAALLWAAQGITGTNWGAALRTAPSAGALYPIDLLVAARLVEGLQAGLWRLDAPRFELFLTRPADEGYFAALTQACLGQAQVRQAAAIVFFVATPSRCAAKYGQRSERYVPLDAGHICQNLLLAAEALNLSACPVGAFRDEQLGPLLGLDGERQSALYLATIGHRR